jgi:hypothetical protein
MADDGGLVLTCVKKGGLLWPARGGWGGSLGITLRPVTVWVAAWLEYGGQGGNVRARGRGTAATPWPVSVVRFRAARERAARGNGELGTNIGRARSAGSSARRVHAHDVASGANAWRGIQ